MPGGAARASGTKACADRCASTLNCVAASFRIQSGICYLKSTLKEGVYSPVVNSKSLFRHEFSTLLTMFRCVSGALMQHGRKRCRWRGRRNHLWMGFKPAYGLEAGSRVSVARRPHCWRYVLAIPPRMQ
jgi:hypothetical protein